MFLDQIGKEAEFERMKVDWTREPCEIRLALKKIKTGILIQR